MKESRKTKKPSQKSKRSKPIRFSKAFFATEEAEEVSYATVFAEEEAAEEVEEIPRDSSESPWTLSEGESDDEMVFRRRLSD